MDIQLEDSVVANSDALSCELEGKGVILDAQSKEYYGLNEVGVLIWQLIASPRIVAELVEIVLQDFDIEREVCKTDCLSFLSNLKQRNLIRIVHD